MPMKIGIHVSIAGGLARSIERANERGCDTIQIFARTPRAWKAKEWDPTDVEAFVEGKRVSNIAPVMIHTCYLLNLATTKPDLREKSIDALVDDLQRARMGEVEYVVTHPGSGHGVEGGAQRVRDCCLEALDIADTPAQLLIENVAGGGGKVGDTFEELSEIVEGTELGVLLDTCHAFAAGIPIHKDPAAVLDYFDETVGIEKLRALHLNDSHGDFGRRVDHHEHIGKGYIGLDGFRRILGEERIRALPGVLETPQRATDDPSDDLNNIATLRKILGEYGG
jgi:deoxyribonuclease-4